MTPTDNDTWLDRLKKEKADLDARLARLDVFIDSDEFFQLGATQRALMRQQLGLIRALSHTLGLRIDAG